VTQQRQSYTVTWRNWDGTVIYEEDFYYGDVPAYYYEDDQSVVYPSKLADEKYIYTFAGWSPMIDYVQGNVSYTAVFNAAPKQYVVTVAPTENGTVNSNGNNSINCLDRHTYLFEPNVGYQIKDVKINGVSVGAVSSYTFTDVCSNQTVHVEFEKIKQTVRVICGENGSADVMGDILVDYGSSVTVNIMPNEKFKIDGIKIN
jgi:hypothetical protein